MKMLVQLYKQNPLIALIINSLVFFVWTATVIIIVTILAVAFTG